MDEIARAYAVIGARPGISPLELRRRYRALAQKWHPDRHARNPADQAEAIVRMRQINDAYHLLMRTAILNAKSDHAGASRARWGFPQRQLSREQIDRLVAAIGSNSPIDDLLDAWEKGTERGLDDALSLAAALLGFLVGLKLGVAPRSTAAVVITASAYAVPRIVLWCHRARTR